MLLQETVELFSIYNNQIHSFDFTCLLVLVGIKIYDRRFPRSCHVKINRISDLISCVLCECSSLRLSESKSSYFTVIVLWLNYTKKRNRDRQKKSFFYVIILKKKLYKVIKSWEKILLLLDCLINFFIKIS